MTAADLVLVVHSKAITSHVMSLGMKHLEHNRANELCGQHI